jgi:hypothetical protein
MDTFLTLVIALGGIATGIGAIWAALAARRQAQLTDQSLIEQRQFLQEQTDIARRQAQVSERNLDLSERRHALTSSWTCSSGTRTASTLRCCCAGAEPLPTTS